MGCGNVAELRKGRIDWYLAKRVKAEGGISFRWSPSGRSGMPGRVVVWPEGGVQFVECRMANAHMQRKKENAHMQRTRENAYMSHMMKVVEMLKAFGQTTVLVHTEKEVDAYVKGKNKPSI